MKFLIRVLGTWAIGLMLVLLVVDGVKSLAADAIIVSRLADYWQQLHPDSLEIARGVLNDALGTVSLQWLVDSALDLPASAIAGGLGVLLLLIGRKRQRVVYAEPI